MQRRLGVALAAAGALLWASAVAVAAQEQERSQIERGRYLLHAGGCVTCHSKDRDEAVPLAGGRALKTPFGTFHTPNITPDRDTGIGAWSEGDFVRALKHGVSPEGDPYYPAFPYTLYAGMTEADAKAIFAYLQSIEPVTREVPAHDLDFPYGFRLSLWPWRWLFFEPATFEPDPEKSERWNRGAYVVRHLGHCGACHTPRNRLGARIEKLHLAGNPDGPEGDAVPNITPHPEDGIGDWARVDLTFFLETGFYPDGDVAGGAMNAVIQDSTGQLTAADREAIAAYLESLPATPSPESLGTEDEG